RQAVLKFAAAPGATSIAGHFAPGTFTNQVQVAFQEPGLLVVTEPRAEGQPLTDASYVNLPTTALCTDSPLHYVDIAIPYSNTGAHSMSLTWWMLAREVLCLCGTISQEHLWMVMPDLYFYRDPEVIEKEEQATAKGCDQGGIQSGRAAPTPELTSTQPELVPSGPNHQFPTDCSAQPATEDWSAVPTAQATEWAGTTTECS
uniref:40S ribosomal protein SA n=1 Tax=Loxodonta africana TaxID=9785 RepID=G3U964_LOXAF